MEHSTAPIEPGLVSVIMSNYNTSRLYIREAINSILTQTYSHFELIIIEDASTNNSDLEIECYKDPRIRVYQNEKNMGLAASLNRAIHHSRGEFIARMDTDDICLPLRFEHQVKYLQEHPDVIVCGSLVEKLIETDNKQTTTEISRNDFPKTRDEYLIYLLFGNSPTIEHPSAMFNNRLLRKYQIKYHPKYRFAQDYRMWVSCAQRAKCAVIPEVLLKLRRHRDAVTVAKRDRQIEYSYQIIQTQLDRLHLTLPEEIRPYHLKLLTGRKPYDLRIKSWIKQLIAANKQYKVYRQRKFKQMLWFGWVRICYFALMNETDKKVFFRILLSIPGTRMMTLVRIYIMRKKSFARREKRSL